MRRFALALVWVAGLVSAGRAQVARATDTPALVVLDLQANRVPAEQVRPLDRELLAAIERLGAYRVISPAAVAQSVGAERMEKVRACSEVACAVEIGETLGVRYLLTGSVGRLGPESVISLKLIDVTQQVVLRRAERSARGSGEQIQALQQVVAALFGEATASSEVVATRLSPTPPDARVAVDGHDVDPGKAVPLAPGRHVVTATREGFAPVERKIDVIAGKPETFELALGRIGAPEVAEAGKQKLAVLELVGNGIPSETVKVLDELLLNELDRRGSYQVISSSDINAIIGLERMKDVMGCTDVACAVDIAGALGVRYLLTGTVGRLGNELVVSLKILDSAAQAVVKRSQYAIAGDERLYARGVRVAVAQLLGVQVEADQPPVLVAFVLSPADSSLELDGVSVDPHQPVPIQPGLHVATATRSDYETVEKRFEVQPGPPARVEVSLRIKPASVGVQSTPPGALVHVDGKTYGRTDLELSLAPGPHRFELELPGYFNARRSGEFRPGAVETMTFALEKGYSDPQLASRKKYRSKGIVATLLAAAAGGVATWQGLQARSLDADLKGMTYGTPEASSTTSSVRRASYVADGSTGLAVVSAAFAIYYFWQLRD